MQKTIKLNNQKISYTLKTSQRAKNIRLAVYNDGRFVVTKPFGIPAFIAERFVKQKADWIILKLKRFESGGTVSPKHNRAHYLKHKTDANKFICERIQYFSELYNFEFNRISIRNQRTRWGSCSRKGNLNFNYKILLLPPEMADYIIVHELCHLKELNHSHKFWTLVAEIIPDYVKIKKELKEARSS